MRTTRWPITRIATVEIECPKCGRHGWRFSSAALPAAISASPRATTFPRPRVARECGLFFSLIVRAKSDCKLCGLIFSKWQTVRLDQNVTRYKFRLTGKMLPALR